MAGCEQRVCERRDVNGGCVRPVGAPKATPDVHCGAVSVACGVGAVIARVLVRGNRACGCGRCLR
eukprot:scaffold11064_cov79-Isochrysis_galbana.AAC.1